MSEGGDARDFSAHELDRAFRRTLAARLLVVLDRHGLSYGVLRNLSRVIDEGRGDLDIWVPAKSTRRAADLIEHEADAAGWWLLKRVRRPYVSSLCFYRPGRPASALTVDLFPAVRWLVADLLSETLLASSRVRSGNFWIVDPRVAALASCVHYLAWSGTIPGRYLAAIRGADGGNDLPFTRLIQQILREAEPDWGRFRQSLLLPAIARSVTVHPLKAVLGALRTVASIARSAHGRWVAFEGPEAARYLMEIDRKLHEEHFLVGSRSSIGRVPERVFARARWYTRDVLIRRRLGAILLSNGDPGRLRPQARIWTARRGWEARFSAAGEVSHAAGEGSGQLFEWLLAWLASEVRIGVSERRPDRGIIVALVGPDGSGKSTLAGRLEAEESLQPTARYHWRPGILPQIRGYRKMGTTKSDQQPGTLTHGWLVSLGRLAYYWMDTQLGFAISLQRQKRAGFVVMIERSFLDVVVDPTRYGFRLPPWILELAARVSLKPDLLLNLSLPSAEAVARKGELSTEETERQAQRWLRFPSRLVDARILDARTGQIDLAKQALEVIEAARRAT